MIDKQIELIKKSAEEAGCSYSENVPLSGCTTFGIGGKCPVMIEVNSFQAVSKLLCVMRENDIPFYIIGRGSNLLVSDRDIDMVFIRMGKDLSEIIETDGFIECQAGAQLSAVCAFARDKELTGLEFAYGIPGSVGGAVYMNAGAYGGEMKDVVVEVTAADMNGNIRVFLAEELEFGYRHSVFCGGGYAIVSAKLRLEKGEREKICARMDELTAKRREKQPLEHRSAGSTFKRPEGYFAAQLIEECGLKGFSCGDAMVSKKHSGFVVNVGKASFEEVMKVIDHVKKTVFEKTGVMLECEPEIIE